MEIKKQKINFREYKNFRNLIRCKQLNSYLTNTNIVYIAQYNFLNTIEYNSLKKTIFEKNKFTKLIIKNKIANQIFKNNEYKNLIPLFSGNITLLFDNNSDNNISRNKYKNLVNDNKFILLSAINNKNIYFANDLNKLFIDNLSTKANLISTLKQNKNNIRYLISLMKLKK